MTELENKNVVSNDAAGDTCMDTSGDAPLRRPKFGSKKRPSHSDEEVHQRKIKRIRDRLQLGSPMESNAVMILHEYDKDLKYEMVGQYGPVHNPSFTMQLEFNGQVFTGTSTSKKRAKLHAAEAAIHALLGDPPDVVASTPSGASSVAVGDEPDSPYNRGINPTVILNRLRPGTTYSDIVAEDPTETVVSDGKLIRGMVCVVDGEKFEGCSTSKKMSKALAADAALRKLFGIQCTQLSDGTPVFNGDVNSLPIVKQKSTGPAGTAAAKPVVTAPNLMIELPGGKNPISLLHELYPAEALAIDDLAPETPGIFVSKVRVEEHDFEGQGTTKKASRAAAATGAVNYLHQSGLLNMKLTEKEIKRRQQVPWQARQRAHFAQNSETGSKPGQTRGRGRGRGRVVARNQPWVSGGVLKANDFLGLYNTAQDQTRFSADEDYSKLAESARNFAAASGNTQGYDMSQGYMHGTAGQGQKHGGATSSNNGFSAYGSLASHTGTAQFQKPTQTVGRGRGRGYGAVRGGGATQTSGKLSATGASAGYGQTFGSSAELAYGTAVGAITPQLMQTSAQTLTTDQYAAAAATPESYTSVSGQQPQQMYEAYAGYDYADSSAAFAQTAYYDTASGQYVATDPAVQQYYSQF